MRIHNINPSYQAKLHNPIKIKNEINPKKKMKKKPSKFSKWKTTQHQNSTEKKRRLKVCKTNRFFLFHAKKCIFQSKMLLISREEIKNGIRLIVNEVSVMNNPLICVYLWVAFFVVVFFYFLSCFYLDVFFFLFTSYCFPLLGSSCFLYIFF